MLAVKMATREYSHFDVLGGKFLFRQVMRTFARDPGAFFVGPTPDDIAVRVPATWSLIPREVDIVAPGGATLAPLRGLRVKPTKGGSYAAYNGRLTTHRMILEPTEPSAPPLHLLFQRIRGFQVRSGPLRGPKIVIAAANGDEVSIRYDRAANGDVNPEGLQEDIKFFQKLTDSLRFADAFRETCVALQPKGRAVVTAETVMALVRPHMCV